MSTNPSLLESPNPKSVTSHLGLGGKAQLYFLKNLDAFLMAAFISEFLDVLPLHFEVFSIVPRGSEYLFYYQDASLEHSSNHH